CARVFDVW
nr:immunoglobulin heavy chain junction region [Mus musculus]